MTPPTNTTQVKFLFMAAIISHRTGRTLTSGYVRSGHEPPRRRHVPLSPPARREPGRLVRVGRRGVRPRSGRGQAAPRLGRLQLVPLVPRDGARVVRVGDDGCAHERALREREGRSRGAARRGRRDDGGGGRDDRLGRLADDGLHDAGREAVLRGHVLPARAAARDPELPRAPARGRRHLARAARRHRAAGRADRRHAALDRGIRAVERAAHVVAPLRCRARDRRDVRAGVRRLRARPQVPRGVDARAPPPPRRRGVARDGHGDARRHGGGRLLRRRRRRLSPLLRGRPLARPALREDALRQRRPRLDVPARLGRHRARALPRDRGGDARVHAARARAPRRRASRRRTMRTPKASRG